MIISDLSILEIISDEKDIVGGAFNFLTTQYGISDVFGLAISVAQGGGNNNFLSNVNGASANASIVTNVSQRNG